MPAWSEGRTDVTKVWKKKKQEMFEKMKSKGQNSRRNTGGTGAFSGSSYSPLQMLAG